MPHTREEVIDRAIREFALLDHLVADLSDADWQRPLARPEGKDPWEDWPGDLDGHSAFHRLKDIERALG